jgi:hypothetical protein
MPESMEVISFRAPMGLLDALMAIAPKGARQTTEIRKAILTYIIARTSTDPNVRRVLSQVDRTAGRRRAINHLLGEE